jgi:hypothetical protein
VRVSISSDKAFHARTIAFERAIHGPKIDFFRDRCYGSAVDMVAIILELQTPNGTLNQHSRFFKEQQCLYCHAVVCDELELPDEQATFQAISATLESVLRKSFRKLKGEDFDCSSFERDLMAYLRESIRSDRSRENPA